MASAKQKNFGLLVWCFIVAIILYFGAMNPINKIIGKQEEET